MTSDDDALWSSAGLVDAGHRIVWARGGDAVRFLNDLLTQDVAGLADGASAPSLLLAPNGRLRAVMVVARLGESLAMVSAQAHHVMIDLSRFRIRVDVELEEDPRPVVALWGPAAESLLSGAGWPVTSAAWSDDSRTLVRDPRLADRWYLAGDLSGLETPTVDPAVADVRRIEVGEPRFGVDIDENTIPNEMGDLRQSVDFEKGCYLGQELVERIDARGRQVKRLVGVVFDPGPVPPPGTEVVSNGRAVGSLSSTGHSRRLDRPVALGTLRQEAGVDDAVTVEWNGHRQSGRITMPPLLTDS